MGLNEFLNLAALIVIPIVAVPIGRYLQTRAKKRVDKMKIFESLMACRIFGLDTESVKAYNMIHITFADNETVRRKWKGYYRVLCIENPSKA